MITDLRVASFPAIYARFVELFAPNKPWLKATEKHQLQFKANPFSEDQIYRDNWVSYGLAFFDAEGMKLAGREIWPTVQRAISFAAQVCDLVDQAEDEKGKQAYLGRIRGAFANPAEMRAIRLELLTAMNFFRDGARIDWPETKVGPERFDILATLADGLQIEVECKSCSPDKGRPIPEKDAAQFFSHLVKLMMPATEHRRVLALKIRVPKRLPTSDVALIKLANEVHQAFKAGIHTTEHGVQVEHHQHVLPFAEGAVPPEELMHAVNELATQAFGHPEGHRVITFRDPMIAALSIDICSEKQNSMLDAMWETAKHAIHNQMTKTRPGCLVLRFEGMSKESLEQVAKLEGNPLTVFARKVLLDDRHQHVACITYVSDEEMTATGPGAESAQSCTYVFDQPGGPYANLGVGGIMQRGQAA